MLCNVLYNNMCSDVCKCVYEYIYACFVWVQVYVFVYYYAVSLFTFLCLRVVQNILALHISVMS